MAAVRALISATNIQTVSHRDGKPSAAISIAMMPNGMEKSVCENITSPP